MTIITEQISAIAGADDNTAFTFAAVSVRENFAGDGIVTTEPRQYHAEDGVLTTDDFDPGAATVQVKNSEYSITIPDSETPVRLWPLIAAGS